MTKSRDIPTVPTRRRLWISTLVGLASGSVAYMRAVSLTQHRDFAQVWFAARAILHRADPYQLIGHGRTFEWNNFFYPLPAAFFGIPFAVLPEHVAMGAFMAIGGACLAWALMEHGYAPLVLLFSTCVAHANYTAQWSPLFAGAYAIAPLGIVLVAKPTTGAAVFLAKPSTWAVYGGLACIVLAFLIQPTWAADWWRALRGASIGAGAPNPYYAPVALPGGPIVLLALLRWRRPEARLLAVLACVPQTLVPYEGVLLLLIPRGWVESVLFLTLSYVLWYWWAVPYDQVDLATWIAIFAAGMTALLYVPATLMVLFRPNEGPIPGWLERRIAHWPEYLRGRAR